MRRYVVLFGAAVAALVLLGAGCGQGPVFYEDPSVLSRAAEASEEDTSKAEGVSDDERIHDPDYKKKIEEEKKQEEEEEEKEEDLEKAIQSSKEALDEIGRLLNEQKIEEAKTMFDDNQHLIQQTADEGMMNENPEVAKLYKQWWETLLEMRGMLDREDWLPEKKSREGINTLVAAGRFKQAAKQMGIYER